MMVKSHLLASTVKTQQTSRNFMNFYGQLTGQISTATPMKTQPIPVFSIIILKFVTLVSHKKRSRHLNMDLKSLCYLPVF